MFFKMLTYKLIQHVNDLYKCTFKMEETIEASLKESHIIQDEHA